MSNDGIHDALKLVIKTVNAQAIWQYRADNI
jgi:hypothetical protein